MFCAQRTGLFLPLYIFTNSDILLLENAVNVSNVCFYLHRCGTYSQTRQERWPEMSWSSKSVPLEALATGVKYLKKNSYISSWKLHLKVHNVSSSYMYHNVFPIINVHPSLPSSFIVEMMNLLWILPSWIIWENIMWVHKIVSAM